LVVVVVLAVAIPFTYIHFIEGKAPAALRLRAGSTGAADASGGNVAASTSSIDGSWIVGSGSIVGYRVNETLVGQHNVAVGRTTDVTGTVVISGSTLETAAFTVEMATVHSNESQRDNQFDGRIMDVDQYPTATFQLSSPIDLSPVAEVGVIRSYRASGRLTLHGQTHPVTFTVSTERTSTGFAIQGDINVVFATWGIDNPSFGFVSTADNGTLEFLLDMVTRGTATPTASTTTVPSQGFGGPITVPATTVPPLHLGS
jgi:polyisoprenoid-binding protein YceI